MSRTNASRWAILWWALRYALSGSSPPPPPWVAQERRVPMDLAEIHRELSFLEERVAVLKRRKEPEQRHAVS